MSTMSMALPAPMSVEQARRFVFLHGFTQSHHHWHGPARAIATRVGDAARVSFVDLPGHGLASDDSSGIAAAADTLPALAGPGTYVGYSMGGRFALTAAASGSPSIERLVLIGATPGIDDPGERADRIAADEIRARHLEQVGVATFVDEWLRMPMFGGLPDDPIGRAHRLTNTVPGLAGSLRACGTGNQPSLWSSLATISVPTLVLAGERDAKFADVGRRMAEQMPRATFATVDDAGHAAHTERPERVAVLVAEWLRSDS